MKDDELVQGWEHSSVHPVHPVTWGNTFFLNLSFPLAVSGSTTPSSDVVECIYVQ